MAGSRYGSYRSIRGLEAIAEAAGRPARQRTTTYGEVPEERDRPALASDGHLPELLPVLDGAGGGGRAPGGPVHPAGPARRAARVGGATSVEAAAASRTEPGRPVPAPAGRPGGSGAATSCGPDSPRTVSST